MRDNLQWEPYEMHDEPWQPADYFLVIVLTACVWLLVGGVSYLAWSLL